MTFATCRMLLLNALVLTLGVALGVALRSAGGGAATSVAAQPGQAGTPVAAQVRTISVGGEGAAEFTPDLARVVFSVETTGEDLAAAQGENAARTTAVLDRLKGLGIAERDLQTIGYNVGPHFDRDRQVGYRVVNGVRATVRDIAAVGPTIDAAIAAGANRVQGVSFDLADRDATVRRAREAAFNDARAKAEQHARLAGVQLGPVLTIVEDDNAGSGPKPVSAPAAARAAAPDTPIEAGAGTIRLTVQITFEMR